MSFEGSTTLKFEFLLRKCDVPEALLLTRRLDVKSITFLDFMINFNIVGIPGNKFS